MPLSLAYDRIHFRPHFHTTREEKGAELYRIGLLDDPAFLEWAGQSSGNSALQTMLEGRVLDFGSGVTEAFSTQLRQREIAFKVARMGLQFSPEEPLDLTPEQIEDLASSGLSITSLNPDYATRIHGGFLRRVRQNDPYWMRQSVAAWGHELPFRDNTFRGILGLASLTLYAGPDRSKAYARKWLSETFRVLEPGGLSVTGPVMVEGLGKRCIKAYQESAEVVCGNEGDYFIERSAATGFYNVALRKNEAAVASNEA